MVAAPPVRVTSACACAPSASVPLAARAGGLVACASGRGALVFDGRAGNAPLSVLIGAHTAPVSALRWAPDAPRLLAAADATTDGEGRGLRHGPRLATGDAAGIVVVWDALRATRLCAVEAGRGLGSSGAVRALEWAAGASPHAWALVVAVAGRQEGGALLAFDTDLLAAKATNDDMPANSQPLAAQRVEEGVDVRQLERDPWDASRMAAGGAGGAVVVASLEAARGAFRGVTTMRVRAAEGDSAGESAGGNVRRRSTASGGSGGHLPAADVACAWSRAQRNILHIVRPRELLSFDLSRGEIVASIAVPSALAPLSAVLAAQRGALLLAHCDGAVSEWPYRLECGRCAPRAPEPQVEALRLTADGAAVVGAMGAPDADVDGGALVAALAADGSLWLWRGRRINEESKTAPLVFVTVSPALSAAPVTVDVLAPSGGRASGRALAAVATAGGGVDILALESMEVLASFDVGAHARAASAGAASAAGGSARGVCFAGRARLLAWASSGERVDACALDLPSGRAWPLHALHGAKEGAPRGGLRSAVCSPSGERAVLLFGSGMEVWELGPTGSAPRQLRTVELPVAGVAWLPPAMPPPRGAWAPGEEAFAFCVGDVSVPLGVFGVREGRVVDKRAPSPPQALQGNVPTCLDACGSAVLLGDSSGGLWRWHPPSGALGRVHTGRLTSVRHVRGAVVGDGKRCSLWAALVYVDGEMILFDVDNARPVATGLGAAWKLRVADARWLPPAGRAGAAGSDAQYVGAPLPGPRLLVVTDTGAVLRAEPLLDKSEGGTGGAFAPGVVATWRRPLSVPCALPPGHASALKLLLCRGAPVMLLTGNNDNESGDDALCVAATETERAPEAADGATPGVSTTTAPATGVPPLIDFGDASGGDVSGGDATIERAPLIDLLGGDAGAPAAAALSPSLEPVTPLTPHERALLGGLRKLGVPRLLGTSWAAAYARAAARPSARLALVARLLGCAEEASFWAAVAEAEAGAEASGRRRSVGGVGVAEDAPREVLKRGAGADVVAAALLAGGGAARAAHEALSAQALEAIMPQMPGI